MCLVLHVLGQVGAGAHGRLEGRPAGKHLPAEGIDFHLFLCRGKGGFHLLRLLLAVAARLAALLRYLCLLLLAGCLI